MVALPHTPAPFRQLSERWPFAAGNEATPRSRRQADTPEPIAKRGDSIEIGLVVACHLSPPVAFDGTFMPELCVA